MRADAAARREEIVRQARRLVAQRGSDVALDVIAEAAGVGIATLYRNFASRSELLDALAVAILTELRQAADEVAGSLGTAPDRTWRAFVDRLVELDLGAITTALADHASTPLSDGVRQAQDDALAAVESLLVEVRRRGLVRGDVTALEFVTTVGLITRPLPAAVERAVPDLVPRIVSVLLAGLRDSRR